MAIIDFLREFFSAPEKEACIVCNDTGQVWRDSDYVNAGYFTPCWYCAVCQQCDGAGKIEVKIMEGENNVVDCPECIANGRI